MCSFFFSVKDQLRIKDTIATGHVNSSNRSSSLAIFELLYLLNLLLEEFLHLFPPLLI
jgi:hypothetical protein